MANPVVGITHPSKIKFGERGRQDYGDIQELAASIASKGVIQPLAVQTLPSGEEGEYLYLLLAGGRRLTAIRYHNEQAEGDDSLTPIDEIPIRIYPEDLSELDYREIELEENLRRKDLEWYERAKMQKALHLLKVQQHGEYVPTRTDLGQPRQGWSMDDTAKMVGVSKPTVSTDIELASAYERHPEVFAKCKTASDAKKLLKKMKTEVYREELAKAVDEKRAEKPEGLLVLEDNYLLGDFFELIKNVPDGSMNMVEIDPPYGMDLQQIKMRDSSQNLDLENYNEIEAGEYPEFLAKVFTECYRVMSDNSWLICWFAHEPWFETVYQLLMKAGFKGKRNVGIWVKPTGQCQRPDLYMANATEMFFYVRKGNPSLATQGHVNHFIHNPVPGQKKVHPTERPLKLIEDILDVFAMPGAKVLTPFAGSGKTIVAAYNKKMTCIGFDLSKAYRDAYLVGLTKGVFM